MEMDVLYDSEIETPLVYYIRTIDCQHMKHYRNLIILMLEFIVPLSW